MTNPSNKRFSSAKEQQAAWREKNKERFRASRERYIAENKDRLLEMYKDHYLRNKETYSLRMKTWRKANPKMNAHYKRAYTSSKQKRTPPWANLELIKEIYRNCPEGYQVDHIVPLRGKTVSGLHVENNLQYLPKSDNTKKANRWQPEWNSNPSCLSLKGN
jgi:hypothetical protein